MFTIAAAQNFSTIDRSQPNPYRDVKTENVSGLDPDERFTDYYILARRKALKKLGAYPTPDARGKPVPITTPNMVKATVPAILMAAYREGLPVNKALWFKTQDELTAIVREVNRMEKEDGSGSWISTIEGDDRVIPNALAIRYWNAFSQMAMLIEAAKFKTSEIRLALEAVWERLVEVSEGKILPPGLNFLNPFFLIKWTLILGGVGAALWIAQPLLQRKKAA